MLFTFEKSIDLDQRRTNQVPTQKFEFFFLMILLFKKRSQNILLLADVIKTSVREITQNLSRNWNKYNKRKIYIFFILYINLYRINVQSDLATSSRNWTHLFRSAQLRIFYGWRIVNMSRTIFAVVIFDLIIQTGSRTIAVSDNSRCDVYLKKYRQK